MNRFRFGASLICVAMVCTGIVAACSSDETTPSGTSSGTTTVRVSAATGGTVQDPSGKTSLSIPPGALSADTDITLTIKPASAGSVVEVSEFGPDGLTFLKPVTLSIKGDASLAPADKTLSVALLEGGTFKPVEGSTYANGAATASIMHFSVYSLIVIDGKAVVVPPASCEAALTEFKGCGGDPKGTWRFNDFCFPGGEVGNVKNCPEITATGDITIERDVVIDATTIKISAGKTKILSTINYPLVCFGRDNDGGTFDSGVNDCATLQGLLNKDPTKPQYACTDKGSGVCACSVPQEKDEAEETQTYTTSGNTITITKANGTVENGEYCATANLLSVKLTGADGKTGVYNLLRK